MRRPVGGRAMCASVTLPTGIAALWLSPMARKSVPVLALLSYFVLTTVLAWSSGRPTPQ